MKKLLFLLLFPIISFAQVRDSTTTADITTLSNMSSTYTNEKSRILTILNDLNSAKRARFGYYPTSGTNTYTVTIPWFTGYVSNVEIPLYVGNINTGASTINVTGLSGSPLGAKTITSRTRSALTGSELKGYVTLIFDGTNFQVRGDGGGGSVALGSITGFGTGVQTALGVNIGSAGSLITNGGAAGTFASGVATNLTGLPWSTGLTGIPTTLSGYGITDGIKKQLGQIFNTTFDASSGSSYTVTSPTTTFTFTSGGLITSGGSNDPTNYVYYTGYVTGANNYIVKANFKGTSDGDGLGIGLHAPNGDVIGRMVMTGINKGQILIDTYTSSVATNRVSSGATVISYTNVTDNLEATFERNGATFRFTVKNTTTAANPVSVEWTDTMVDGATRVILRAANPAAYHYGGGQTILTHKYIVNDYVQQDLLFAGDSETYGTNGGGANNTFAYKLKASTPNGVNIIAGIGNFSSDIVLLLPEIVLLKPRVCFIMIGLNDVFNSVSAVTTQANYLTIYETLRSNGILPVFSTITEITSGWTGSISNATAKANIISLNSYLTGLGFVKIIDVNAAVSTANILNNSNAASDGYHLNGVGHQIAALTIANGLRDILNIQFSPNSTDSNLFYDRINGFLGIGSTTQVSNEVIQIRKDQNAATRGYIVNATSGTAAFAQFQITKSSTGVTSLSLSDVSTGFSTSGMFVANSSVISSNSTAGLNIGETASAPVTFWTNNAERARFLSTGEFLAGYTATAFLETWGFGKNQNALTRVLINNTTSGTAGQSQLAIYSSAGTPVVLASLSAGFTTSGINQADGATLVSGMTNGLNVGTNNSSSLKFWTNNAQVASFDTNGFLNFASGKSMTTGTLDFASTGAGAVADLTLTVTGAAVGDGVILGVPNGSVTSTATFTAWVSATNTVTVRFSPKATEDPASGTFKVIVVK